MQHFGRTSYAHGKWQYCVTIDGVDHTWYEGDTVLLLRDCYWLGIGLARGWQCENYVTGQEGISDDCKVPAGAVGTLCRGEIDGQGNALCWHVKWKDYPCAQYWVCLVSSYDLPDLLQRLENENARDSKTMATA